MIALYENSQWVRTSLAALKIRFPNVSFIREVEQTGQTWTVDGTDYEAKLVVQVPKPVFGDGSPVDAGPLEDVAGVPTETWIVGTPPTQAELDAELDSRRTAVESQLSRDMSPFKALAAGLHEHENRLRNLEGDVQPQITFAQVLTWLRGKL